MPRGFKNIASGADLPERLVAVKDRFLTYLKANREKGLIVPPDKCATAKKIVAVSAQSGVKISDVDVRALTNYHRRNDEPIGSSGNGYFYATGPDELDETIQHLNDRINAEMAARDGLLRAQERMRREKLGQEPPPSLFDAIPQEPTQEPIPQQKEKAA